jgi:hypothetical protein
MTIYFGSCVIIGIFLMHTFPKVFFFVKMEFYWPILS